MRVRRSTGWFLAVAALGLLLAGCNTRVAGEPIAKSSPGGDRGLVQRYFSDLNASGDDGTSTQRDFLRRTQHPDYTDQLCDLGDLTLRIEPAMSTFRADPDWVPPDADDPPRGTIYVLGVSISIRQQGALLGEQIGSQRVVVLDGKAYGFSPCPTE
jgi:predicted small secreted protein